MHGSTTRSFIYLFLSLVQEFYAKKAFALRTRHESRYRVTGTGKLPLNFSAGSVHVALWQPPMIPSFSK